MRQQAASPRAVPQTPYERGCEAFDDENWTAAVQAFGQVAEEDPHYAEAQTRLREAQRQQDLLDRYKEGQRLMDERAWERAQAILEEVANDVPDYRDVQGLLQTSKANSPNVSTTWLGISLGVFIALYVVLGATDLVLMRRYANPRQPARSEELPAPGLTY